MINNISKIIAQLASERDSELKRWNDTLALPSVDSNKAWSEITNIQTLINDIYVLEKIRSIKTLRAYANSGLREAKQAIEWASDIASPPNACANNSVFVALVLLLMKPYILAAYKGKVLTPSVAGAVETLFPEVIVQVASAINSERLKNEQELAESVAFAIANAAKLGHTNALTAAEQVLENWKFRKNHLFELNR